MGMSIFISSKHKLQVETSLHPFLTYVAQLFYLEIVLQVESSQLIELWKDWGHQVRWGVMLRQNNHTLPRRPHFLLVPSCTADLDGRPSMKINFLVPFSLLLVLFGHTKHPFDSTVSFLRMRSISAPCFCLYDSKDSGTYLKEWMINNWSSNAVPLEVPVTSQHDSFLLQGGFYFSRWKVLGSR